ncbi:MAG: hypothetical protein ABSE25_14365 [Syntrophorhabdales bacterium]|jgi:hypothetical protein
MTDKWPSVETLAALACATGIVIVAFFLRVEGAKDIGLAVGGGICGYLSKGIKTP